MMLGFSVVISLSELLLQEDIPIKNTAEMATKRGSLYVLIFILNVRLIVLIVIQACVTFF